MGTHLIVLTEGYPMNTNTTGFKHFSKIFALFERSLSIRRVNTCGGRKQLDSIHEILQRKA